VSEVEPRSGRGRGRRVLYRQGPNGGLVFALAEDAERVSRIHTALANARTWGEFRRLMPSADLRDVWAVVERQCADYGVGTPSDADSFSAEMIPGFCDGDYPTWLQASMDR
jgi:hypothetical protein